MPLSENEQTNETASELVSTLHGVFGPHPGYRPAHAKGTLITGTFTPTPEAATLTTAKHFTNSSTEITVRFSSSTGIPNIPDTDPNSVPRGFAIRFFPEGRNARKHTDIVTHSTPFFPVKTGADFLGLLKAQIATADPANAGASPSPIEKFLGEHPETLAFIQAPKPVKQTLAALSFFGVNAFKFIDADGKTTYLRYRVVPTIDAAIISGEELQAEGSDFLFDEIKTRVGSGPVEFKLVAQIADEGDPTNDATIRWPDDRKLVELGTLKLEAVEPEEKNKADQKYFIFDPVPRIDGVESSDDPLIDMRAAIYLISGRERRAA